MISGEIPLWLVDGDDRIAFVNDAAVRVLGFDSHDELVGRPSHDSVHFMHPDGSPYPAEDCPITHATRRGEPIRMDRDWWVRKDGSFVPISIHCVPLEIDGRMGTAMTFHDLTVSVQAEDDRRGSRSSGRVLTRYVRRGRGSSRRPTTSVGVWFGISMTALRRVSYASHRTPARLRSGRTSGGGAIGRRRRARYARSAIEELRQLAHGIHPALLSHSGLAAAVRSWRTGRQCPSVSRSQTIAIEFGGIGRVFRGGGGPHERHQVRAGVQRRVATTRMAGGLVLTIDDDGNGGAPPPPPAVSSDSPTVSPRSTACSR